jgi:hypothetical protein
MSAMLTDVRDNWGTTADERAEAFPCDEILPDGEAYYRAVTVHADVGTVFRWLCQLRVAPYSYDWIDNLGRRSPQTLTPGLDELDVGQRFMTIFELVRFDIKEHITLQTRGGAEKPPFFGRTAVSYTVVPVSSENTRLVVKILFKYPYGPVGWLMRWLLPWGDLVMMRRQLLNLKRLAENAPRLGDAVV